MRGSIAGVALAVAAGALGPVAGAAPLPRLDVVSFTFASDASALVQERPFHLVIDVRLKGRIGDLAGVVLPQLGTLEILGDEKHTIAQGALTEYRETIGVVSHRGGTIDIPPAYLDAIDVRDGKPKRFLSNPLALRIAGPASVAGAPVAPRVLGWLGFVLGGFLIVALAFAALRMRRPPDPIAAGEPERATLSAPPPTPFDAAVEARRVLASGASRENASAARSELWHAVGAGDGETLADVVRRPEAHEPALRAVLRSLERAAFTDDADRPAAVADALRALDGYRA